MSDDLDIRRHARRCSDAEREVVIGQLSHAFVEGRLSQELLHVRVAVAQVAVTRDELKDLVCDLPDYVQPLAVRRRNPVRTRDFWTGMHSLHGTITAATVTLVVLSLVLWGADPASNNMNAGNWVFVVAFLSTMINLVVWVTRAFDI